MVLPSFILLYQGVHNYQSYLVDMVLIHRFAEKDILLQTYKMTFHLSIGQK